jgi:Zn-dependent peptidase ImmA (M78 family)
VAYNPNILRDMLKARSLSRATLSRRLNIDVDDLDRELKREPEPKQSLLNNIAHELALPAFVFYMKEPPPLHDLIPDFRSITPAPTPKKRETIEAIQFAAGVQRAGAELKVDPAKRLPRIDPTQSGDVEQAAASARKFFKITLEDQLEAKDAKAFYVLCRKRIEDQGIFVLHDSFPDEDGSGFCLADHDYPLILINTKNQNRARRLFTLIHELGHVLSRQTGISDPFVRKNALERYCNHFAGAFLVPAEFVEPLLKGSPLTNDPDLEVVKWVSRRLKISQQAAVLRLEQLNRFKAGSHEKWLRLIHNSGNPDWKDKGGGAGGPPPQEKVKLAKYGFHFAKAFSRPLKEARIDPIKLYRATGLKPKFQRVYFDYAASIGDTELRTLELDDE